MTKKRSRTMNAALNSATSFLYQLIRMISLFVIPRLIMSQFGSEYNGITNSITQFLGVVSLMSAGIGGVTSAALYKPLVDGDVKALSRILKATEIFLRKISIIFCAFLIGFACLYPLILRGQFGWLFSFSLILIIGISTVAEYCFGMTYRYLFQSDQRMSVVNIINSIATVINILVAVVLIKLGFNIHIVKLGSALAFCINPILLYLYARKEYTILKNVEPDNTSIKQRWDAFAHQVALFIHTNTDTMILTVLSSLKEVSVYSVYSQITNGIYTIFRCFFPSINSAFGEMFAKKENAAIKRNFAQFEMISFSIATVMYATTICTIVPFVRIYTSGVKDANYIRPLFGYLLTIGAYFFSVRVPYQNIIEAVGHFKQTKKYSYIEAVINILSSVILVIWFGIVGVAIGTLLANIYRTFCYAHYISKNLIDNVFKSYIKNLVLSTFIIVLIVSGFMCIDIQMNSVIRWICVSLITFIISSILVMIVDLVFYKDAFIGIVKKLQGIVRRPRVQNTEKNA